MMELKNKYYHGVRSHIYHGESDETERRNNTQNDILYKYECILNCGYILPYKKIRELYGDVDRHRYAHNNGEDRVSISLHGKHPEQRDIEWMRKYRDYEENAFNRFIFSELYSSSIVLNESIKDNYELIPNGMYLERQIAEPVSLEYMDAISIFTNIELIPYFENEDYLKKYGCLLNEDFNIEFLYKLKDLLEKYGYNVPIINIETGSEFSKTKKY